MRSPIVSGVGLGDPGVLVLKVWSSGRAAAFDLREIDDKGDHDGNTRYQGTIARAGVVVRISVDATSGGA